MKREDRTWIADLSVYLLADKSQKVYDYRYVEEKTGISHDWIFRIWNGKADPRGSHLVKIARFLGYEGADVEVLALMLADSVRWKRKMEERKNASESNDGNRAAGGTGAVVRAKR